MGTETLPSAATVAAGLLIKSADFLTVIASLQGAFVGRNTSGIPTSGQSLGTVLYPWGPLFCDSITIGGSTLDLSNISVPANRIISGATSANSGQPLFLQANGSAATVTILATATDLVMSISAATITVSTDIVKTSLTTAPAANNTCQINDTRFADQAESKYFGEIDSSIPYITIDTVGSNISALVGQWIALKTDTSEIMFGWLKSATELVNVYRGFFFNSSNVPIVRETLINNEVLTLMKTGWIFIDDDGATIDITYTTPVYAYDQPAAPAAADYWHDLSTATWKRWSGSEWVAVDRIPIGLCIQDSSNCIATRSFDFFANFTEENTLECEVFSDAVVRSQYKTGKVNVYGIDIEFQNYPAEWDTAADMSSGTIGNDTDYYLYLSTAGEPYIDKERPYDRSADLRGRYHPYENWRYIAKAKTDGAADWISVIASSALDRQSQNARWDAEGLVITVTSSGTATCVYDSLTLVNREGKTKTLYNGNHTFDMSLHLQGAELASTWQQLYIDSRGKLAILPDITGTADGTSSGELVDSGNAFVSYSVFKGSKLYNTTANTNTTLSESPTASGQNVALDSDIMTSGDTYVIHMTDPVGLDSFACNIGSIYNDAGSDFDVITITGRSASFITQTFVSGGNQTSFEELDLYAFIPITCKKISGYIYASRNENVTPIVSIASKIDGTGEKQVYVNTNATSTSTIMRTPFSSIDILNPQKIYAKEDVSTSSAIYTMYISQWEY